MSAGTHCRTVQAFAAACAAEIDHVAAVTRALDDAARQHAAGVSGARAVTLIGASAELQGPVRLLRVLSDVIRALEPILVEGRCGHDARAHVRATPEHISRARPCSEHASHTIATTVLDRLYGDTAPRARTCLTRVRCAPSHPGMRGCAT